MAESPEIWLRALKGAPLSCLVALALANRSVGVLWLAGMTGYAKQAVTSAMQTLAQFGLAEQTNRYDGWRLTVSAAQLPLFTLPQVASQDAARDENHPSPSSSSSSLINLINLIDQDKLLLPLPARDENHPSRDENHPSPANGNQPSYSAEAVTCAEFLVERTACSRSAALSTMQALLDQGYYPAYLQLQALRWSIYAESEHGRTINHRGAFVLSKLRNGEPCPAWSKPEPYSADAHLAAQLEQQWADQEAADTQPAEGTHHEPVQI